MTVVDRNSLAFWFPHIEAVGLRVPCTRIVETDADLVGILDGEEPIGWDELVSSLQAAGDELGWPAFLRTGHGSGKHEWARCCYVPSRDRVGHHVAALVEWSHSVDMFGLPTNVWALRQLIPTAPLFVCDAYDGFPVVREFRLFVRGDQLEHVQPYWPPGAVEVGRPDDPGWRGKLEEASEATAVEYGALASVALEAVEAVGGGYWSVDLLEDRIGEWWLTDMAEGDSSFRWEPA